MVMNTETTNQTTLSVEVSQKIIGECASLRTQLEEALAQFSTLYLGAARLMDSVQTVLKSARRTGASGQQMLVLRSALDEMLEVYRELLPTYNTPELTPEEKQKAAAAREARHQEVLKEIEQDVEFLRAQRMADEACSKSNTPSDEQREQAIEQGLQAIHDSRPLAP